MAHAVRSWQLRAAERLNVRTTLALLIWFSCMACSATGGNVATNNSAAAGTWTGSWLSRNGIGGTTVLQFTATPSALTGSVSFTNSPCFATGNVSASVTGDTVSGTVSAGNIDISIQGTIIGNTMSGTYDAISAGACTGDTGTFQATR